MKITQLTYKKKNKRKIVKVPRLIQHLNKYKYLPQNLNQLKKSFNIEKKILENQFQQETKKDNSINMQFKLKGRLNGRRRAQTYKKSVGKTGSQTFNRNISCQNVAINTK